jgi:hypothetical protein
VVIGAADLLTTAAAAARAGAVDNRIAKQVALHKIGMARSAGFDVEEDLSIVEVTTPSPATRHQREALAVTHARRVWNSADTLAATDREAARKITQAVEGLGDLRFPTDPDQRWPGAMMADYAGVVGPLPGAPHLISVTRVLVPISGGVKAMTSVAVPMDSIPPSTCRAWAE